MTAFTEWLRSGNARRCLLIEVEVNATTLYLSTREYTSGAGQTPANKTYSTAVVGGVSYTESLDSSISYGDIEIDNTLGTRDAWLGYIWSNAPIRVYAGDATWDRDDFELVLAGVVADIQSRSRDRLNLILLDKMTLLDSPISETLLGGATDNAEALIPLCFGECFNIAPLLTNPATLEYQVHNGQIERIIEVRDNGAPVAFSPLLATGKFTLASPPLGQVTASVQGHAPFGSYSNKIVPLIKEITKEFGAAETRLTDDDLDLTALTAFDSANQQAIGVFINSSTPVKIVISEIAASIGAGVVFTRAGLLKLVKLDLAGGGTAVGPTQRVFDTLEISERPKVQAGVDLGYCKNWTLQPDIQTGILPAHKALFAKNYRSASVKDAAVATNYKIGALPAQVGTLLLSGSEATTEANRRLTLWKTQRTILTYKATPELLLTQPGDYQTITATRFGLTAGVNGQVITVSTDWINFESTISVMI